MRKLNTILSVLLLVIFLLHGIMGSFMLLAAMPGKFLHGWAWLFLRFMQESASF